MKKLYVQKKAVHAKKAVNIGSSGRDCALSYFNFLWL